MICIGTDGRRYGATSDADGRFWLGMLPPGPYWLSAVKSTNNGEWALLQPGGIEVLAGSWSIATQPSFGVCGNGIEQWIRLESGSAAYRIEPSAGIGLTLRP